MTCFLVQRISSDSQRGKTFQNISRKITFLVFSVSNTVVPGHVELDLSSMFQENDQN